MSIPYQQTFQSIHNKCSPDSQLRSTEDRKIHAGDTHRTQISSALVVAQSFSHDFFQYTRYDVNAISGNAHFQNAIRTITFRIYLLIKQENPTTSCHGVRGPAREMLNLILLQLQRGTSGPLTSASDAHALLQKLSPECMHRSNITLNILCLEPYI